MFRLENILSIVLVASAVVVVFFIPPRKKKKKSRSKAKKSYPKFDKENAGVGGTQETYKWEIANVDSVYNLMDQTLEKPSSFYQEFPLLFLLSGNILEDSVVHAIVAKESFSSTLIMELWKLEADSSWTKISDLFIPDLPEGNFDPLIRDYNFDGIKDIYIPFKTASNQHYQLENGLICTLDSAYQIREYSSSRDMCNIELNDSTQTVFADEFVAYPNGTKAICRQHYKWIDTELELIYKTCP